MPQLSKIVFYSNESDKILQWIAYLWVLLLSLFQDLLLKEQVKDFAANVYEAFCQCSEAKCSIGWNVEETGVDVEQ